MANEIKTVATATEAQKPSLEKSGEKLIKSILDIPSTDYSQYKKYLRQYPVTFTSRRNAKFGGVSNLEIYLTINGVELGKIEKKKVDFFVLGLAERHSQETAIASLEALENGITEPKITALFVSGVSASDNHEFKAVDLRISKTRSFRIFINPTKAKLLELAAGIVDYLPVGLSSVGEDEEIDE